MFSQNVTRNEALLLLQYLHVLFYGPESPEPQHHQVVIKTEKQTFAVKANHRVMVMVTVTVTRSLSPSASPPPWGVKPEEPSWNTLQALSSRPQRPQNAQLMRFFPSCDTSWAWKRTSSPVNRVNFNMKSLGKSTFLSDWIHSHSTFPWGPTSFHFNMFLCNQCLLNTPPPSFCPLSLLVHLSTSHCHPHVSPPTGNSGSS